MNQVCGFVDVDLDGRFDRLRYEETNLANFITDLMLTEYENCEIGVLNTGALRSNAILPRGEITIRMVQDLIPMIDKIVVLRVPGDILKQVLENSVSQWPSLDGRFGCFSGLKFSFDPDKPVDTRVHSVRWTDGTAVDLSSAAKYTMAVKKFIAVGKDGYAAFLDPSVEWISDVDAAMTIQDVVFQAFEQFSAAG